eukprot:m.429283 g.429283  ORF g.429283 m.429283 type:complete len:287 (+) comp16983_c0_seq1:4182-5042(+)
MSVQPQFGTVPVFGGENTDGLGLGLSPSLFADLGPLLDYDPFEPFSSGNGPSSPSFDMHDEVHDEVKADDLALSPVQLSPVQFSDELSAVPVSGVADMEQDESTLDELLSLNLAPEPTPEWVKVPAPAAQPPSQFQFPPAEQAEAAPVKAEFEVPVHRPRKGAGSRRKVKEEIKDDLDMVIYSLFPADVLRLPRVEFQQWREQSGMRPLSVPEQKRLAKIRRMILARVYAERTRLRKIDESMNNGQTLTALRNENGRLKKKAAKLEAAQAKLLEQVKRLLALQKQQ